MNKFIEKFFLKKSSDGTIIPPQNLYSKEELQTQTDMVCHLNEVLAQKDKELAEERERVVRILSELSATKREKGGAMGNVVRDADLQLAILHILHPQRVEVIN